MPSMQDQGICPIQVQEPRENEREKREFLGAGQGVHVGKSKSVVAGKGTIEGLNY